MPIKSKYLFVASMDVDPDKEALFNEVYDNEHSPLSGPVSGDGGEIGLSVLFDANAKAEAITRL